MGDAEEFTLEKSFYHWVNKKWLQDKTVVIPPDYPRWGSFIRLADEALKNQIALVEEIVAKRRDGGEVGADELKIGLIWEKSLDRFEEWKAGKGDYAPVVEEVESFEKIMTGENDFLPALADYFSRCQELGIRYPFEFDKGSNLENSECIILDLGGGGLSLPSRAHYFDDKYEKERGWFKEHLHKVYNLLDSGDKGVIGADFAERVLRFERKLAAISMKQAQRRSYDKYYTLTTLEGVVEDINELKQLDEKEANYVENRDIPGLGDHDVFTKEKYKVDDEAKAVLGSFFKRMYANLNLESVVDENFEKHFNGNAEFGSPRQLTCFDGDYFRRIFMLLMDSGNQEDIKAYMKYKIISFGSSLCTKELDEEFFDFHSRKLSGQQEQKSSEKRSVNLLNAWVGELVGKVYVARYFSEGDKRAVELMIEEVVETMKKSLATNNWLTKETKDKAIKKLEKFIMKIGYTSKWKDFETLDFKETDSLLEMKKKVNAFNFRTEFLEKLNTRKDKTKWEMFPQTVNAYFHPANNEIVFPAAILQYPFYSKELSDLEFELPKEAKQLDPADVLQAVNFGGIGSVIAHECTHGYDDQGRKFDDSGNLNNWWSAEDEKLFLEKAEMMNAQAKEYSIVVDGKKYPMNPELTTGENLADLGGLSLGAQACIKTLNLEENSDRRKTLLRCFFMSWANIWKCKATSEFQIRMLAVDPHAPVSFRGNLVSNVSQFYEAFPEVKEGFDTFLSPEKRVQMW